MTPEDIKALRLALTLSQDAFARKLGVTVATIQSWELARRHPDPEHEKKLQALARKVSKSHILPSEIGEQRIIPHVD